MLFFSFAMVVATCQCLGAYLPGYASVSKAVRYAVRYAACYAVC